LKTYNHHIPQRALKHQTPIQALQKWRAEKPDLFVKRVYEHAGLDSYVFGQVAYRLPTSNTIEKSLLQFL
jgi:hypothetical protein